MVSFSATWIAMQAQFVDNLQTTLDKFSARLYSCQLNLSAATQNFDSLLQRGLKNPYLSLPIF